jgi:hypothetical protein
VSKAVAIGAKQVRAWLANAAKESKAFVDAATRAKHHAILAGHFLHQAKAGCEHGTWLPMLKEAGITERSAQRFMAFYEGALLSAVIERDELDDSAARKLELVPAHLSDAELFKHAKEAVLHSTLPFTELLREFEIIRPFGEYDAVRHSVKIARGAKAGGQLELSFDYTVAVAGLRVLDAIDRAADEAIRPGELEDLEARLEGALVKVRERKTRVTVDA